MERITFDNNLCGGKPCIRGMRIRVTDVLELLAAGISIQDIVKTELPDLEYEDVVASINYALSKIDHPVIKAA